MTAALSQRNTAFTAARPRLSVLVPFYRESPLPLLRALSTRDPHDIELILIDDGSGQPELTADICAFLDTSPIGCELITLEANEGRARGRNRLTQAARGNFYLFLDADMLPDDDRFLDRWLATTLANPPVVFGGFSLAQAPQDKVFEVHRLMAAHSDCLDARTRALTPEKYVFTSNLLIRHDVFAAESFDPDFSGWGWEDVEWAMRVAARFGVQHIDNTATHMGLDHTDTLARKYEQSVGNFARVVAKHPEVISQYPSYKIAKLLKKIPAGAFLRMGLKAAALNANLPPRLRALSLRAYRAALYARVV